MNRIEKSREHIDMCVSIADDAFKNGKPVPTVDISDTLAPAMNQKLTPDEIDFLAGQLRTIARAHGYTPRKIDHFDGRDSAARNFIDEIRRYFPSNAMRIEINKGVEFHKPDKKRKYDEYLDCAELRAYACQRYRQLVFVYIEQIEILAAWLGKFHTIRALREFRSDLRCEQCGRGAGKHVRAGLLIDHHIKKLEKETSEQ